MEYTNSVFKKTANCHIPKIILDEMNFTQNTLMRWIIECEIFSNNLMKWIIECEIFSNHLITIQITAKVEK